MHKKYYFLIALLIVLLILVIGVLGYTINISNDDNKVVVKTLEVEKTTMHAHEKFNVPDGLPRPEIVQVVAVPDAKMGWNIELKTKNFEFTPQNVNEDHVDNQGHAHLYINGEKVTRLYSPYHFINGYDKGVNEVRVTLNTNEHKDYAIEGQVVEASVKLVGEHDHDSNESEDHEH